MAWNCTLKQAGFSTRLCGLRLVCLFFFGWWLVSFFASRPVGFSCLISMRRLSKPSSDFDAYKLIILVNEEIRGIVESIRSENEASEFDEGSSSKLISCMKETFTVPSNLRRVQQALILYAFPQLSGGNSITNYFIPILKVLGLSGDSARNLFLNGMYALSKFFFAIFASFFFIDILGRRNSLFIGITLQMISDLYFGIYLKVQQDSGASHAAGEAALASIFIHALGYTVGKFKN